MFSENAGTLDVVLSGLIKLKFITDYRTPFFLHTHSHTHTRRRAEKLSSGRVGIINLRLSGGADVVLGDLLIRHE